MSNNPTENKNTSPLWKVVMETNPQNTYGIADGAASHYIHAHLIAHGVPHLALYKDDSLPKEQSPYVFPLKQQDVFSEWYLQESKNKNWGIVLQSQRSLADLLEPLKHHLTVQDEQGHLHLMRYYDPRVTRAYLSALAPTQAEDFFKSVSSIWTDTLGVSESITHHSMQEGQYQTEVISLSQAQESTPKKENIS